MHQHPVRVRVGRCRFRTVSVPHPRVRTAAAAAAAAEEEEEEAAAKAEEGVPVSQLVSLRLSCAERLLRLRNCTGCRLSLLRTQRTEQEERSRDVS